MQELVRGFSAFAMLGWLLVVVGCGDAVNGTAISGKVTYRGQPLADGSLTFYPQTGRPISTGTDSTGVYTVELPPGEYQVAIQAPGVVVPEGWKEGDPNPPPPAITLPPQYSQRAKTTLNVSVAEGGAEQEENFDLK
jgi:hypothetical protein